MKAQCLEASSDVDMADAADPLVTDLQHFHPSSSSFEVLPRGEFTMVRKLATAIHGDVFRYRWAWQGDSGEDVCVKRLRNDAVATMPELERDERSVHLQLGGRRNPATEDALTEIGVLQYLSKQADLPAHLMKMLGVFQDSAHAWLVMEFASGGELFEEVARRGRFAEAEARRYSWEILQAVAYLHRHGIGHRDISLENVLLKDGAARVMDFGMAVRSHTPCGTPLRYFRTVGKDYYRAPECYVPTAEYVQVVVPARAEPGAVATVKVNNAYYCEVLLPADAQPNRLARAKVFGYTTSPADVHAVGVCFYIMLTGSPPWAQARPGDGLFDWVRQHSVVELMQSWGVPTPCAETATLLKGMLTAESSQRWSADQCLASPCFSGFSAEVPARPSAAPVDPLLLRSMAGA